MQKRTNPFASPLKMEEPKEKKIEIVEEPVEEYEEEEIETYQPQIERYVPQQPQRQAQKTSYSAPRTNSRDKYTSTMDQNLRRKIRIECAKRGILFKTFVEEACREKLAREGVK